MSELPAGTVTFLFSDIEGSTRLVQRLGPRFEAILAAHHRLLRAAFGAHDGHEFGTEGDAFFVAFERAGDAVEAAVDAQRALSGHSWGGGEEVRVRMGIHTGEPAIVGDGYVGLDLHRVARICSAAHGGQILVSATTGAATRDHLPPELELRDLGAHRLKDLAHPEHLYEVAAPDLPGGFPPPRSMGTPSNLPAQLSDFVGREEQQRDVTETLRRNEVRLLTLTGPGGTGKTRLSLRVAADVIGDFPDGVFFVPLAPLREASLVAPTIAQTIGAHEAGTQDPVVALEDHLADKRLLLVLDNFEHVGDAAHAIARLLSAAGGVKALVTSRAALRLSGEHEYQVPPLSLARGREGHSEAALLFLSRARAVKPDFDLSGDVALDVGEICERLDGLPLAIELAAARVKVLTPQAILKRLEKRLQLLTGGPAEMTARQRTLRGAIDWSYDLLEEDEQRFFRRLAVFSGGWTLDAAEAVVGADGALDALEAIASLVDKSLVRSTAEGGGDEARYSMLATIREYGVERLEEAGEADELRSRHAARCLSMARRGESELLGPEAAAWGRRLESEHDNVRAALRWALAGAAESEDAAELSLSLVGTMGRFWYRRGHLLEGCEWAEAALATNARRRAERAKVLHLLGVLLDQRSEHRRAREMFEAALELYRELGDFPRIAEALNSIGVTARSRGEVEEARRLFTESLEIRRALGEERGLASALGNLGVVTIDEGDTERARELLEESLEIDTRLGERWGAAINTSNLATVALEQGDLDQAHRLLREAARLFDDLEDADGLAECLETAARLAAVRGEPAKAARLGGAAESLRERIDSPLVRPDLERLNRYIDRARAELDPTEFERAWQTGRAMTLEQAIEHSLSPKAESPPADEHRVL